MNNTTYGKRTDLQREGACSKDIWRLYFSLPQNTYFDLYIISSRSGEELEHIGFAKCGCAMEEKPIPEYEQDMKAAFRKWGYNGYDELRIVWRKGFGNSVQVFVMVDQG